IGYEAVNFENINGTMMMKTRTGAFPMSVFGDHNAQNIEAARLLCAEAGVDDKHFYIAIQDFKGAARRMQLLAENENTSVYLDFAHAPSKVKATTKAMKARYPKRKLVACLELHTFSSLNQQFLPQYAGALSEADQAFVYFNPEVVKHKNLPELNKKCVKQAFNSDILVFTDTDQMMKKLLNVAEKNCTLLIMTSGNLDGCDIPSLANKITDKSNS
ncbi:MAG: peptidoglycan synthetase, partial [Candidatus Delongbacteria bacterium]|nr:peptidoglycan synthetase [Candidatus Delongbacteria bacterium]